MNKRFYVLVDKRDLRFHVVDGNTTDDIMDALSSQKLETIKNYLKNEIDEDAQKYFNIYEVHLDYWCELVEV